MRLNEKTHTLTSEFGLRMVFGGKINQNQNQDHDNDNDNNNDDDNDNDDRG